MTNKKIKSGEHPTAASKGKPSERAASAITSGGLKPASKSSKLAMYKRGRPQRQDNPQKITLHLGMEYKRRAFDLATARRCSIGRLVEDLIAACKE